MPKVAQFLKGAGLPANLYTGYGKAAGWRGSTVTGTGDLTVAGTYNDHFHALAVTGKSWQNVTVQVKNMLSLWSTNISTSLSGSQDKGTSQAIYRDYDVIYGATRNGYIYPVYVSNVAINPSANTVSLITSSSGYGVGVKVKNLTIGAAYAKNSVINGVGFFDANGNVLTDTSAQSFTVPSNTAFAMLIFTTAIKDTLVTFANAQLELGSTATPYAPFVPNSPSPDYPSAIVNSGGFLHLPRLDPIAMPTLRQNDVWSVRTGVVARTKNKIEMDGVTPGRRFDNKNPDAGDYKSFYLSKVSLLAKLNKWGMLCSHFPYATWTPPAGNCWWEADSSAGMRLHKSYMPNYDTLTTDAQRVAAANAWLAAEYAAGRPVTVEYDLETPTTETVPAYPDIPTTYKTTQITVTDCDANVLPEIAATLKVVDE